MKNNRVKAEKLYGIAHKKFKVKSDAALLKQLEAALYAGKIAASAQGFAIMEQVSTDKNWNLPLGTIASIWREGCIIPSQFLDLITSIFKGNGGKGNQLGSSYFAKMMKTDHTALRKTNSDATLAGLPTLALSAALGYFDTYQHARGTTNLTQDQRDIFGAYTFELIGEERSHRGRWVT